MENYFSVVATSAQVNTPPGSYSTLREWALNSFMDKESKVLEVGCSTGFISIELARYVRATCLGVDLHLNGLLRAKMNVDSYVAARVSFSCGGAQNLPFKDGQFDHVVIGGHLPFITSEDRVGHILESCRVVRAWGYLLVAIYYYRIPPPSRLVKEMNSTIGTFLSVADNKSYWTKLFERFPLTLEYEAEYRVVPGSKERVHDYLSRMPEGTREAWKKYLHLFNQNGRFLNYFVRVYRKIPNAPTLMIQIPRGGIYETRVIANLGR